jgi:hypothetical protein
LVQRKKDVRIQKEGCKERSNERNKKKKRNNVRNCTKSDFNER